MNPIRSVFFLGLLAMAAQSAVGQTWQALVPTQAPSARNGASLAFDDAAGIGVLFGGYDAVAPGFGDTWLWSGADWQPVAPAHSPSPRWGHAMAFDAARRRVVLFGGFSASNGLRNDVWEWDGSDWTERTVTTRPAARSTHGLVFDRERGVTVLFGGAAGTTVFADTWVWNGSAWLQKSTASAPPARRRQAMAYDEERLRTVLFGGLDASGNTLADTWTWDGTSWQMHAPATAPTARQSAAATADPRRGTVLLCGGADATFATNYGDAWEWDGGTWHALPSGPGPRHAPALAYDRRTDSTLLFGGRDASFQADTWRLDLASPANASQWSVVAPNIPFYVEGAGMVFDAARNELILHGGYLLSGPPPWSPGGSYSGFTRNQTYRMTATGWVAAAAGTARADFGFVYDSIRSRSVVFGGKTGDIWSGISPVQDTRVWNGTAWSTIATTGPSARSGLAMAFDPVRDRIVLFGGTSGAAETWEFDGVAWQQRSPTTVPPGRRAHAMAYDATIGRVVMHGGNAGGALLGDTWEYDGVDWTSFGTGGMPARNGHRMVYDPVRGGVVAFGGSDRAVLAETWVRTGGRWYKEHAPGGKPRANPAMAYDGANQRAVAFGGLHYASTYENSTVALQPSAPGAAAAGALATPYGSFCGGQPMRILPLRGEPPRVGGALRAVVVDAPQNFYSTQPTFVCMGLSASQWPYGALPFPLVGLNWTNCMIHQSGELMLAHIPPQIDVDRYEITLALPNVAALAGVHVYAQPWTFLGYGDLQVGAAIDWQIGNY